MPEQHPEKLDLTSQDINEEKLQQLKQVVPEAFTEDGYIDFDKLKTTLGEHVDEQEERFGLQWPGKRDCFKVIQEPAKGTLQPAPDESEDWSNTENLFIEGDNLEVLKLLQKSYYGKVKMIYIDPPYNTGNEFIYPDDYKENLNTYLAYTGQVNEEGYKFSTNTETEGRYHSNWLNMMYPRLFMARNLLKDDGVIFISIDDHEVANLRKICDEIFGEENFITQMIWRNRKGGGNDSHFIAIDHEYVLVYLKNKASVKNKWRVPYDEEYLKRYKEKDDKGRFYWDTLSRGGLQSPIVYDIECPDGSIIKEGTWQVSYETFLEKKNRGDIKFEKNKNGQWTVFHKVRLPKGKVLRSILSEQTYTHSDKELSKLFNDTKIFDNPKPVGLLETFVNLATEHENEIILDFFAGSSPAAEAVFNSNQTDSKDRKFIMIQLPEPTQENSNAKKQGYENIADIGKERIRRAAESIKHEKETDKQKRNGELFKDEVLEEKQTLDLGFRVFKLDQSNFKEWGGTTKGQPVEEQLRLNVDHVRSGSSEEEMLYEILLKSGYPLTVPIDTLELAHKKVYSIVDSTMLICLEDGLDEAVIVAMAEKKPNKVVVLDKGFNGQDELKTNAVQIMKSHGVEDFRTV